MFQSIGSDMEVFAHKGGNHVALCGKIGGSKSNPMQVKGLPAGFLIQEDNVALEFNIPVCYGRAEFIESFRQMRNYTSKLLAGMGLELSLEASVSFDKAELFHPQALVFGCEPDYDAWAMVENSKPKAKDETLRTAGGHIHVGTNGDMVKAVRYMDLFLGVPSLLLDNKPSSLARRELYGKAGAMRPKPYGFEYRVLSNFWHFDDKLVSWVFNQTRSAANVERDLKEKEGDRIVRCINTGDKKMAEAIIKDYCIEMPSNEEVKPKKFKTLTEQLADKTNAQKIWEMTDLAAPQVAWVNDVEAQQP